VRFDFDVRHLHQCPVAQWRLFEALAESISPPWSPGGDSNAAEASGLKYRGSTTRTAVPQDSLKGTRREYVETHAHPLGNRCAAHFGLTELLRLVACVNLNAASTQLIEPAEMSY
jgi:hypothetical protein